MNYPVNRNHQPEQGARDWVADNYKMVAATGFLAAAAILALPSQSHDLFWSVANFLSPTGY